MRTGPNNKVHIVWRPLTSILLLLHPLPLSSHCHANVSHKSIVSLPSVRSPRAHTADQETGTIIIENIIGQM